MKVVIAHRSGEPRVVDLAEPHGGKSYVTVRVSHSAVVLPDELYELSDAPRRLRRGEDGSPLGSMASGTIMEVGADVRSLKAGLRVAVSGKPYSYHGGILVVPENLVVELPKKVNHEEGSYAGLGARAMHLLRTAEVQLGDTVLVVGADMIGLLTAQLVRSAGATPILIDESEYRLNKARALGIMNTHTPIDDQLLKTIDSTTDGHGVDVALLTRVGDVNGYVLSTELLREGGMLVSAAPFGADVPVAALATKTISMRFATDGGIGAGDRGFELRAGGYPRKLARWTVRNNMSCFCNLLADRRVQISPLITDRVPVDRAAAIYDKSNRSRDAALGVVFTL